MSEAGGGDEAAVTSSGVNASIASGAAATDQPYNIDVVRKETIDIEDLMSESLKVRGVVLPKMKLKDHGEATMPSERLCALLDPW